MHLKSFLELHALTLYTCVYNFYFLSELNKLVYMENNWVKWNNNENKHKLLAFWNNQKFVENIDFYCPLANIFFSLVKILWLPSRKLSIEHSYRQERYIFLTFIGHSVFVFFQNTLKTRQISQFPFYPPIGNNYLNK